MPFEPQEGAAETDLVSDLAARVQGLEDLAHATTQVVDEKALKELRRTIEALAKRDPKFEERVTNKVDVLADRIETVAKTVSNASAAVAAKDGEIAQLRRELETSFSRVNAALAQTGGGTAPAEIAELKRALDELRKLSTQRMPRGLEGRIEELEAKFTLVAQRVDSVSSTISTTAAGLVGRDGDVNALRRAFEAGSDRVEAELAELRRAVDPTAVADLRQELKELADETSRRQHAVHNQLGQAGARADALTEKVEALSGALGTATGRVAATEEGLSAFRTYFEEAGGKLSTLLAEHNRSLAALSTRTTALEQADGADAQAFEERLQEVGARLDRSAERLVALEQSRDEAGQVLDGKVATVAGAIHELTAELERLSTDAAATRTRLDARDDAAEETERRFQDASSRVDALVADLSRALSDLPDPNSIEQAVAARVDEVAGRIASLADHVSRVETSALEQARAAVASAAALERLRTEDQAALAELAGQVEALAVSQASNAGFDEQVSALRDRTAALEQAEQTAARELEERVANVSEKLDDVSGRLDSSLSVAASVTNRVSGAEDDVSELRGYVEEASARLTSVLTETKRSLGAIEARTSSLEQGDADTSSALEERISATAAGIEQLSSRLDRRVLEASEGLVERIDELAASLSTAAEERAENASEIARVAAILEVERASLRTKLDSLVGSVEQAADAPDTEELERRVIRLASRVESLDGERTSVQAQFDAIANALASIPQHSPLEQRLDELARRVDELQERGAAVASKVSQTNALLPTALRSLEARLDDVAPGTRPTGLELDAEPTPVAEDDVEAGDPAPAAVVPLRTGDP